MTSIPTTRKEENNPVGDAETRTAPDEVVWGGVGGYGTEDEDSAEDPSECLSTKKAGVDMDGPPKNEAATHISEKVLFFACGVSERTCHRQAFSMIFTSSRFDLFTFLSVMLHAHVDRI
jgi:hypothetical protein